MKGSGRRDWFALFRRSNGGGYRKDHPLLEELKEHPLLEELVDTVRHNSWLQTAALISAAILGTGVLALPVNLAKLGWTFGTLVLSFCYPLNFFTGYLLNKLHLAYPDVLTLGDLGQSTMGPLGAVAGYGGLYMLLFANLSNYFACLSRSVQQLFYQSELCLPTASLVALILMLPLNQLRTLFYVSFFAVVSCLTIVAVVVISVIFLLLPGEAKCSDQPVEALDFWTGFGAFSGFMFAYSAQQLFLEMQAEMKYPEHFVRSLHVAYVSMFCIYMVVALVVNWTCGAYTPAYLLEVVPKGPWLHVVGFLMLIHMLVSYTITQQILTRGLLHVFNCPAGLENGIKGRVLWLCATTGVAFCASMMANAVPKFDSLVDMIGAVLVMPLCFIMPISFFLVHNYSLAAKQRGSGLVLITSWTVLVFSVLLWVVCTISGVKGLVSSWSSDSGKPFSCHAI